MLTRCSTPCVALGAAMAVGILPHFARAAIVAPKSDWGRFTAVSVGRHHTCGLTPAGSAYCWGDNSRGQVGDETTTARSSPVLVVGRVSFAAVSAGGDHTCAVTTTGAAYCWGSNDRGELGDGTTSDRESPTPVAGGVRFAAVSAGLCNTCGVTAAGAAYCWGSNQHGELGVGTTTGPESCTTPSGPFPCSTVPRPVQGTLRFAAVSAGVSRACGVTAAGAAYCWGSNEDGQLGGGTP